MDPLHLNADIRCGTRASLGTTEVRVLGDKMNLLQNTIVDRRGALHGGDWSGDRGGAGLEASFGLKRCSGGCEVVQLRRMEPEGLLRCRASGSGRSTVLRKTMCPGASHGLNHEQAYQEGAFGKKGQLLVAVSDDPTAFQAALDQAEGQLGTGQGLIAMPSAAQGRTQLDVERYGPLAKEQAASQQDLTMRLE